MDADLTNRVDDVPERFDPVSMRGEMTEAEHLARYAWAAELAPGRRVLDAGCGLAYGTALLAAAGPAEVTGIDSAAAVVEAARARVPEGVSLLEGDVCDLDLDDDRFDLVVCFEVIEHVEGRERCIAELARVLAPGGVLLLSSPNREVYVPGNPHHVHEYAPEELREALAGTFPHVQLWRQHQWIASAILDDESFAADDLEAVPGLRMSKSAGARPGEETYTLAAASDAPLPSLAPAAVATGTVELRRWVDLYHEQQDILRRQHEHFAGLVDQRVERAELRRRLVEAERRLARIVELEQEVSEAQRARGIMQGERDVVAQKADQLQTVLDDVLGSPSWRITAPLRKLKNALR